MLSVSGKRPPNMIDYVWLYENSCSNNGIEKYSSVVQLTKRADKYNKGRWKKKIALFIIRSVDTNVDFSIDAKCYGQSFNSSKRYSMWNFIARGQFD